jgi:hypothetical protein
MGTRVTSGALRIQKSIPNVVITLFEFTAAWVVPVAVTYEVRLPVVSVDISVTVSTGTLVLPPAGSITEAGSIDEIILVVSPLSVLVRLNVSSAQAPVSLFVIVTVYPTLPPSVEIVWDEGFRIMVAALGTQPPTGV